MLIVIVLLGVLCALGLMGFVYYQETHLPPVRENDVIIVLGAQVKEDGTPSVALERRLTAALESYREKPQVIIVCGGRQPDEQTMTEAAQLAAWYSQARQGQNVPVDTTLVRNVKKPAGSLPGMVIYDHYTTAVVTPDAALVQKLREG